MSSFVFAASTTTFTDRKAHIRELHSFTLEDFAHIHVVCKYRKVVGLVCARSTCLSGRFVCLFVPAACAWANSSEACKPCAPG
eukprot:6682326-Prymnesium_polylepis.2